MPAWAPGVVAAKAAENRGGTWILAPEPADLGPASAMSGTAGASERGARLVCAYTGAAVPSLELAVAVGDRNVVAYGSDGAVASLAGVDLDGAAKVHVTAWQLEAQCTEFNSPWSYLLTGTPLPVCDEKRTVLVDTTATWAAGPLPLGAGVSCAAVSRADVDVEVQRARTAFDTAVATWCATPLYPDGGVPIGAEPQRDAADALTAMVAAGGWGHPDVRLALAQFEALTAEDEAAVTAQIAADAASATPTATIGDLTITAGTPTCANDTCTYPLTYAATGSTAYEVDVVGAIVDPAKGAWGTVVGRVEVVDSAGAATIAGVGAATPGPIGAGVTVPYLASAPAAGAVQHPVAFLVLRGPDDVVKARLAVP